MLMKGLHDDVITFIFTSFSFDQGFDLLFFLCSAYQRKACKIAALHFWRNFDHRCAEIFVFFLTDFFLVGTEEMLNVNMRFPDSLNNWSSLK